MSSTMGSAANGIVSDVRMGGMPSVRRQLFFRVDDNYFSLSTTTPF